MVHGCVTHERAYSLGYETHDIELDSKVRLHCSALSYEGIRRALAVVLSKRRAVIFRPVQYLSLLLDFFETKCFERC